MSERYKSVNQQLDQIKKQLISVYDAAWINLPDEPRLSDPSNLCVLLDQTAEGGHDIYTIHSITSTIVTAIPDGVFTQLEQRPISHIHLSSMLRSMQDHNRTPSVHKSWYRRLITAFDVADSSYVMSDGQEHTDQYIQQHFERMNRPESEPFIPVETQRKELTELFTQLLRTMTPKVAKEESLSAEALDAIHQLEKKSIDRLRWHLTSDPRKRTILKPNEMVEVYALDRKKIVESPRQTSESAVYNLIRPKAFCLRLGELNSSVVVRSRKRKRLAESDQEAVYSESLVTVHELLHTLATPRYPQDDFHRYANELITDAGAESLILQGIGKSLKDKRLNTDAGYRELRDLAVLWIRLGWIEENHLISSAINQDPIGFFAYLKTRLHELDPADQIQNCKSVVNLMCQSEIIPDISGADHTQTAREFYEDPYNFLKTHMNMKFQQELESQTSYISNDDPFLLDSMREVLDETNQPTVGNEATAKDISAFINFISMHADRPSFDQIIADHGMLLNDVRVKSAFRDSISQALAFQQQLEDMLQTIAQSDTSVFLPPGSLDTFLTNISKHWLNAEDLEGKSIGFLRFPSEEALLKSVFTQLTQLCYAICPPEGETTQPDIFWDQLQYLIPHVDPTEFYTASNFQIVVIT